MDHGWQKNKYHSKVCLGRQWNILGKDAATWLGYFCTALYLSVEAFLVADHLDCDVVVLLVVVGLDHLPERPLPDHLQNLVPVRKVVVRDVRVRTLWIWD